MQYMAKEPVSRDLILTDGSERVCRLINNRIKCTTGR